MWCEYLDLRETSLQALYKRFLTPSLQRSERAPSLSRSLHLAKCELSLSHEGATYWYNYVQVLSALHNVKLSATDAELLGTRCGTPQDYDIIRTCIEA